MRFMNACLLVTALVASASAGGQVIGNGLSAGNVDEGSLYRFSEYASDYGVDFEPAAVAESVRDDYLPGAWQLSYDGRAGDDAALSWVLGVMTNGGTLLEYAVAALLQNYDGDPTWERVTDRKLDRWKDGAVGYTLAGTGSEELSAVLLRSGNRFLFLAATGLGKPAQAIRRLDGHVDRLLAIEPDPGPIYPGDNPYLSLFDYEAMVGERLWTPDVEQSYDFDFETPGGGLSYAAYGEDTPGLFWQVTPVEGQTIDELKTAFFENTGSLEESGLMHFTRLDDWNDGTVAVGPEDGGRITTFVTVVGDYYAAFSAGWDQGFGKPREVRRRFKPILERLFDGPLEPTAAQILARGAVESGAARTAVSVFHYLENRPPDRAGETEFTPISNAYFDVDITSGGVVLVDFHHPILTGRMALKLNASGEALRFDCRADLPAQLAPRECERVPAGSLPAMPGG